MDVEQLDTRPTASLAPLAPSAMEQEPRSISLRFSLRQWLLILAASLLTGALGLALALASEPQYTVTRELLVASGSQSSDNETLLATFQYLLSDRGFAAQLRQRSGVDLTVDEVQSAISVDRPTLSALLTVAVTHPTQEIARKLSDNVVPTLREVIEQNQRQVPLELRLPGPVVQEVFNPPRQELTTTPWYFGLAAGLVPGFVVAFLLVALRNYRRPVLTDAREVGELLDLPVLGRIPAIGERPGANPQDSVLGLLAAVERLGAKGPIHRLVVVGPEANAERSRLILALGCAIARNFDQPVTIVDADLENSSLTKLIGAGDEPGLSECLTGELRVDQGLLRLEDGHAPLQMAGIVPPPGMLRVLPAGLNRSGSLLRMRSNLHQVLGSLSGRYVVIVDGPQVPGPVPASQLLNMADATLVLVTEGQTAVRDARFTGDALRSYSTSPMGAVLVKP